MTKPKPKLQIIVKKQYSLQGIGLLKAREEAGWVEEVLSQKANGTLGTQQNISKIESSLLPHIISKEAVRNLQKLFDVHFEEHTL